ncbi:MAG TPA: hypothetical protein VEB40_06010 [Flavipsychrobacter sp.]|nr:hypothetical protein [Flavipsychrobacter sp.]
MRNLLLTTVLLLAFARIANAQNASAGASQQVSLTLSNVIAITFTGTGTNTGSTVNMAFNTVNDYLQGVTSAAQQLKVQSNTGFNVAVKFDVTTFSYVGQGILNLNNIPTNVFQARVTANNTGGSIASPFSATSYAPVYSTNQDIITGGQFGDDQNFSVMYKVIPGLALPAGIYTIDIVYTATQQ